MHTLGVKMEPDWLTVVKTLLELGWPGIITAFFGYLAIQYIADQRKQIDTLWARLIVLETELSEVKRQLLDDHLRQIG